MLEVGNGGLTLGEQRAHFALWALLKSPLLVGTDLRRLHPDSLAVLKAREVIAVNQDDLGVAGDLIWVQGQSRVSASALHRSRVATAAAALRFAAPALPHAASLPPLCCCSLQVYASPLAGGARAVGVPADRAGGAKR